MRPKPAVLFAFVVLSAVCFGQWSEPVSISDTVLNYPEGFQLAAGAGDTLWAFYIGPTGVQYTSSIFCHRSTGDSWTGPQALNFDTFQFCLASGVDPQRRVWLSWYDGNYLTLHDTWGVYTRVHDSLGWGDARLAMPAGGIVGLNFAAGKDRNWHMGICVQSAPLPGLFTSALYSPFVDDTWRGPRAIATGYGSPLFIDYGLPTLVARPDTGLWAVYSRRASGEKDRVLIDHLIPDSSRTNLAVLYGLTAFAATADSAGQMWVIYVDTLGAVRSITYDVAGEKRRQLVTDNRRWVAPQVCTDAMGWVWAFWVRSDTSLVVSCNWGNRWSEPEVVTSKTGCPEDIVSDRHGRIYVSFYDMHGRYWTCYRTSRPGIGDAGRPAWQPVTCGATVIRSLPQGAVVFDAMGRRVLNPRSGVLFVREPSAASGQPSAVTKVVVQR